MTTELFGIHTLILFIMVMTTIYAYVIIIHTVTSHEQGVQDYVVFFNYESQSSVLPVEHEWKHLDTDTLPKSRW